MSITLHYHPFSSFCWKVLVGLYELEVPFEKHVVDLGDPASRGAFVKLWPMGKFPVIEDARVHRIIPESTVILEYLDRHVATTPRLIPTDPDRALECRLRDRFYDLHIHVPMQKIVGDHLRPADQHDPFGVAQARNQIETAYAIADAQLSESTWAAGESFSMADCAAAPALFYANKVVPFEARHRHLASYFARLSEHTSFARVLDEAKPFMSMFPA